VPAPFPLELTLARTGDVAVSVHGGLAYPNGFTFRMLLLRRQASRDHRHDDPLHHWHHGGGELPSEALRFGIRLSDGSKATIFDARRWFARTDRPKGPVLIQRGGNGGLHSWDLTFWVWPLPPGDAFAFVVEWPSEGIELHDVECDTAPILAAAQRAETLWPGDDAPKRSGGAHYTRRIG
jgi:hypothetical protein